MSGRGFRADSASITHPALAKAASSCRRFDEAVRIADRGSDRTDAHSYRRPDPASRLWPSAWFEYLDVDPVAIQECRESLEAAVPGLEHAIEETNASLTELAEDNEGAADKAIAEAKEELAELDAELRDTRHLIEALRAVGDELDDAAEAVAGEFVAVAEATDADVEIVLTMKDTAEEYGPAAENVSTAATAFDAAGEAVRDQFSRLAEQAELLTYVDHPEPSSGMPR